MIRDEVMAGLEEIGRERFVDSVFSGFRGVEEAKESLIAGLCSGHNMMILGPPGCGKTTMANRIASILGDIEVVSGCPLNCAPEKADCPWCKETENQGAERKTETLAAAKRIKKVQGSAELVPQDIIGDLDPEAIFTYGLHSPAAYVPGKLIRANRGVLLVDFIDRIPERVLNTMLYALGGGTVSIGAFEESIDLDVLVIATGSERSLSAMPLDLVDCFDVVTLQYPSEEDAEKGIVLDMAGKTLPISTLDRVVEISCHTRTHSEVLRGASTRGTIKYAELASSLNEAGHLDEEAMLRTAALVTLPHRLQLTPDLDLMGKREEIVNEILDEVFEVREDSEDLVSFSAEDIMSLVEEIAREDHFRKPLKYGAFDLLLRRVRKFPESKLAQAMKKTMERLQEMYPERFKLDNVTHELLVEIEDTRKMRERMARLSAELEEEALAETLAFLEEKRILDRGQGGWEISRRSISLLLQRLTPKSWERSNYYTYGKHATGKKLTLGEGKVLGTRKYRFGDRYRDVSFKDTIRQTIHNRRRQVTREDIMVTTKDIRAKLDIILAMDLSGTMRQLEKLWYAKESAIVLALACAQYGDRVGVVSFSNLADVVVDITGSPHLLTERVVDLDLHENAFTNIGYAILKANQVFSRHRRSRANQHIILISDGDATAPHPSPQKYALREAAKAAKNGITISCVCINQESTDPELMRRISRIGKGRTYVIGPEGMANALLDEHMAANIG
ncbi:MAG: VWA domain-containing protein [Thermodesulfobacteriota bacterium]|nr:VWA domain-containing protein [Thermodesulfobacteriota bacterium]